MDHAQRGDDALNAGKTAEAIDHFTKALQLSPSAPSYYIKRATAYQRSSKPDESLSDADLAVTLAISRAKRDLIAQAQLRRAIALFQLERYGDANCILDLAKNYSEGAADGPWKKSIPIWKSKVENKLEALEEGDVKREVTVEANPGSHMPGQKQQEPIEAEGKKHSEDSVAPSEPNPTKEPDKKTTPTQTQTPPDRIRHDWYQSHDSVTFTLLAKGVPRDQTSIDIEPDSLSISFPLVSSSTYTISFDPLFSSVDPTSSTSRILTTKIEIVLRKATPGVKWKSLEGNPSDQPVPPRPTTGQDTAKAPASSATLTGPSYPTSARGGPKNWDKIAEKYSQKKAADNAKGERSDGEEDGDDNPDYIDDYEDADPVNGFFKKLYAGASDETRRAMMKSYQESNGTALSTNWEEVRKGPVETTPPEGMEAKKWGQ